MAYDPNTALCTRNINNLSTPALTVRSAI